jgi:hypothetical protein
VPFILEDNFTTSGEVWIMLKCYEAAHNITLNINDIEIYEDAVKVMHLHPKGNLSIQVCTIRKRLLQDLHDSILSIQVGWNIYHA